MSKARLVITAVILEKRPVAEVARDYGVARSWVYELLARYRVEGEAAFEPHSRRPHVTPNATPAATVELVLWLRKELTEAGHDAGADTICWHLAHDHQIAISRATVHRILTRHNKVTPEPKKRPKSSYIRFQAEQPNQTWQSDFTHYRLTSPDGRPGADTEILSWLDDCTRMAIRVTVHRRVTGIIVRDEFRRAIKTAGIPVSTLTDNGLVFTARFATGKGGRTAFEAELARLGITQKNSRPNHPTTCGKVERFQQTMKKWLAAQPVPPATIDDLQAMLDAFVDEYNRRRPHRSLPHRAAPATLYDSMPKALPGPTTDPQAHERIRHDRIDKAGSVTIRHNSRLHHIGVGRTYAGTCIILLIQDLQIRIVDAATGELLRELILDPTRDYQPTGAPKGPTRKAPK